MLDRSIPPKIKTFSEIILPEADSITLKNGVRINVLNLGVQEVSRIDIIMNGGLFEEAKCGAASMTLKSLVKGTEKHSETEIAEILDFYGAWVDYNQSDHHSLISLYIINKNFREPLKILKEMIHCPVFPEKEIEISKKRAVEIFKSQNQKTKFIAASNFSRIFFGESHPLGMELNEERINNLNSDDLFKFHKLLVSSPFSITLSGKISKDMLSFVSELFSTFEFPLAEPAFAFYKQLTPPQSTTVINKADAVQSTVLSGAPAPKRSDKDYIPLRILVELFGGFFGSRINMNIREKKGLTYGINAGLLGRIDSAHIQITTDCDNKYVHDVIAETKNEMNKLHEVKVEEDELNLLKSYMLSDYIKMVDSPFSLASFMNNKILYGFPDDYFQKQIELTENITADCLQVMANRYLIPDNFTTVIVGNENLIKI